MKKLLIIAALVSVSSVALAWEQRGADVAFETRPLGVSAVEPLGSQTMVEPMAAQYAPAMSERTYPTYYRGEYRPVRGVVRGAATAAEGVVEGTAQAVESVIP